MVIGLLLVACALGLSNLAGAIGIGISGVDSRTRWRVGVVFGLFEAGMPIVGLLLGQRLAVELGAASRWIGAALLIATGGYALWQSLRPSPSPSPSPAPAPSTSDAEPAAESDGSARSTPRAVNGPIRPKAG